MNIFEKGTVAQFTGIEKKLALIRINRCAIVDI
jgi:hypothetical protein